jgi:uncharacterized repeat protein (TIGR01451 family)
MRRLATVFFGVSFAAVSGMAVAQTADLAVTKTGSPDPVVADTDLTYSIVLTNKGPDGAEATVKDALPPGVTFVSFRASAGWQTITPTVGGGGTVTAASSNVKMGATATFTLVVHAEPAPRGAPAICNTVTVASTTADPVRWNNSANSTTQVKGSQADLAVTMTPEPIAADGNLTYTMVVTNNGPDGASATLDDALPPGTTFVSLRAPADWLTITPAVGSAGTVTSTTPTLANGATGRFALVVHVDPAAPGGPTIRNTAVVASTTTDPIPGNNSATVTTTPIATANATATATKVKASRADLAVTMTGSPDTVVGNTNLTYTILVTNNGPDDADVTLTDALPPGVTLVSWSLPPDWEMTPPAPGGSGTVAATNPTLADGATATLTLVVRVEPTARAGSTIRNAATVASTTGDPTPENNIAATTTPVQEAHADLAVTQTASPDPVLPGNDLSYSIVVTNNGPGDAATVTLNDALPPGVSFVSFDVPADWRTTTPAVGGTGTVTASNSTVANGDTATFTLVVRVDPAAAGGSTIRNTATVASETSDPMSDNNSATATTQVKGSQADLAVVVTASPDPVAAGSDVTYAIVVTNNGPDDAASATLIDPLPPGTTVISFTASSGWASSAPAAGAGGTVTATAVTLPNGASAMFRLIVRVNPVVPSGSTIANTATVSATAPDPTAANNSATATITTARP